MCTAAPSKSAGPGFSGPSEVNVASGASSGQVSMHVLGALALARLIAAHGSMISPLSRNAADRSTIDNATQAYDCNCGCCNLGCGGSRCTVEALASCQAPGVRANMSGQPCLWFSQGCGIGCAACDNNTQHSNGKPLCPNQMEPTLSKSFWTMNRHAQEDPAADAFKYHPWRAPGFAPVVDVCGVAGGRAPCGPNGCPGAGVFTTTALAKQGDLGSHVLPKSPSGTVWRAGDTVEVSWGIRANHGGGYQFRICPADQPLTEECMQKTPLPFAHGRQSLLRYKNGTSAASFAPVDVDTGTNPKGSAWRMNPIPPIVDPSWTGQFTIGCNASSAGFPTTLGCQQFEPVACREVVGGDRVPWAPIPGYGHAGPEVMGSCSGNLIDAAIVDYVVIPGHLVPGDYVVGFRWDCE